MKVFCFLIAIVLFYNVCYSEAVYRHIRPIGKPNVYTTAGYISKDYPVPQGFEIVDGRPPKNAKPVTDKADRLEQKFLSLYGKNKNRFDDRTTRQILNLYIVGKEMRRLGDFDRLRRFIQTERANLPPEVQPLADELLTEID